MEPELKGKTIAGMMWTAAERFGGSLMLFIANLVLARLLTPHDFGAVAMLMVFISLSETLADGGFGSALIQKRVIDQRDCSTIFVWNVVFSLLLYLALFVSAPLIANFYSMPVLKDVLRVQGLLIVFNSLILVHMALLRKRLDFKTLAKTNLIAIGIGTAIGIIAAYNGLGVWSLVLKLLATAVIQIVYYYTQKIWSPSFVFDFSRFKKLAGFGGYVMANTLTNTLYHNLLSLIIGKSYSSSSLGCYNQARKLEDIPRSVLSSIVNKVTFPVFSKINGNKMQLAEVASKCMRSVMFFATPSAFLLIAISKPLILFLFTDKWIESVSYFQILCIGGLFITSLEGNTELLNALGKSNTTFYIRLAQCAVSMAAFLLLSDYGVDTLLYIYITGQALSFVISAIFSGRNVGYGFFRQLRDIAPFVALSAAAYFVTTTACSFFMTTSYIASIVAQTAVYVLAYVALACLFGLRERKVLLEMMSRVLRH